MTTLALPATPLADLLQPGGLPSKNRGLTSRDVTLYHRDIGRNPARRQGR